MTNTPDGNVIRPASEMTPKEYEEITQAVAAELYESVEGAAGDVRYGAGSKLQGIAGYVHQIDVSILSDRDLVLVECKNYGRPVDVPTFLAFLARVLDIRALHTNRTVHPIVVTTVDFDPGVEKLAGYYGIGLERVKSVAEFGLRYKNAVVEHCLVRLGLGVSGIDEHHNPHGNSIEDR